MGCVGMMDIVKQLSIVKTSTNKLFKVRKNLIRRRYLNIRIFIGPQNVQTSIELKINNSCI